MQLGSRPDGMGQDILQMAWEKKNHDPRHNELEARVDVKHGPDQKVEVL